MTNFEPAAEGTKCDEGKVSGAHTSRAGLGPRHPSQSLLGTLPETAASVSMVKENCGGEGGEDVELRYFTSLCRKLPSDCAVQFVVVSTRCMRSIG